MLWAHCHSQTEEEESSATSTRSCVGEGVGSGGTESQARHGGMPRCNLSGNSTARGGGSEHETACKVPKCELRYWHSVFRPWC